MKKIIIILIIILLFTFISCKKKESKETTNENKQTETTKNDDKNVKTEILEVNIVISENSASSSDTSYIVTISHDEDYTYIIYSVSAIDGYTFTDKTKLYVNGTLKTKNVKLESDTLITYKVLDDSWSPVV